MRQEKAYAWLNDYSETNHKYMKLFIIPRVILSICVFIGLLFGCMTASKVDPAIASRYEGFICDGKTTKQHVQDRLGQAVSVYENSRILIYYVYIQDDERMQLTGRGTCHALVLVFDKDNLLERHSLVKHGCRE